jgi:hypothetical protein
VATPRSSGGPRRSSTTAGRSATTTRSWRSTTSVRAGCPTPSPSSSTVRAGCALRPAGRPARGDRACAQGGWCNESQERYVAGPRPGVAGPLRPVCASASVPLRRRRSGQ